MILNLDKDFNPFPNEAHVQYESFTFNGGEPHIRIHSDLKNVKQIGITQRVGSFHDFGLILFAVDALKRMGVNDISLHLPYFPAARQDRVMQSGEALSVKVYADLLNQLNLNSIHIFDPHSDVTPALLNNCKVMNNHHFIAQILEQINEAVTLIAPDAGAVKKVYSLATSLGGLEVVECSKVRDTKTGELSAFKAYTEDLQGKNCLIVDDICDGGGTFIGLAKELQTKNVGKLYLAVSHGIFSKGLEDLLAQFEHIFTTNSFSTLGTRKGLTQLNLAF